MKFRKKPVVIEAIQWDTTDETLERLKQWHPEIVRHGLARGGMRNDLLIPTLEGDHTALPNDWIIRGIKGEVYPCKPDIFAATYEPADLGENDQADLPPNG